MPEVVQTSAMDCGPAALKCLLEGFGVTASYGRLREACHTDVDGTSIDTLEEVALQLGLDAEQIMLPPDHVFLPEASALPALAVVRRPTGITHFVVLWSRLGGWCQVMDPAVGRRWMSNADLAAELYVHRMAVPAAGWREWAGTADFEGPLRRRMRDLRLDEKSISGLWTLAVSDRGWKSLAALDAAIRMSEHLASHGGCRRGPEAARVVSALLEAAVSDADPALPTIPDTYWSVRPVAGGQEELLLEGAVVVRVRGLRTEATEPSPTTPVRSPLPPDLAAALREAPPRPGQKLLELLRADGLLAPRALAAAIVVAAAGVVVQAVVFRSIFDAGRDLALGSQRLLGALALLWLVVSLYLLDLPLTGGLLGLGRALENRLRIAFLSKIPLLGDRYFQSRLASDMADRSHNIHQLRNFPQAGGLVVQLVIDLAFTTAAIIWLQPASAALAVAAAGVSLAVPLFAQKLVVERDLRVRTHLGALARFHLDSLLGLWPIRSHGAEAAVRREHDAVLDHWREAVHGLLRVVLATQGVQQLVGYSLASWLVYTLLSRSGEPGSALLLVYWALSLPERGFDIAMATRQYPAHRNLALRMLEPLGAPDEGGSAAFEGGPAEATAEGTAPLAIAFRNVSVRAAGHTILEAIDIEIEAGSHVAIVGPSGAGKSTLVGLLLGWNRPATGDLTVDGYALEGPRLEAVRRATAWVDPGVQIWNRSLVENLTFGAPDGGTPLGRIIDQADLRAVLEALPDGLQTILGEGGGLVSGGEGQRVRLGRCLYRGGSRLAVLDEPFRGLERESRRVLLERCRTFWREATLLCVTHDVGETAGFPRVLVVEGGRIVEDGPPAALAARPDSRYRALLDAEAVVRDSLWGGAAWRRLRMQEGRVASVGGDGA